MSKILEMREKRAKAWAAAKAFLDTKRGDDGLLAAADTATYDKMEADVVSLGKEIDRLERQAAIDMELANPTSAPIKSQPEKMGEEKTGRASAAYQSAFWANMRGSSTPDIRNDLKIGSDPEGGYLVPDEFEQTLVEALEDEDIFRKYATIITTSSGDRKIPLVATKGEASWVEEEGKIPESDDTFGQITIGAHKLATLIKVSEELLNDSAFNMESYISRAFAKRIGTKEEEAFIVGDGVGKPIGLLADAGGAEEGVVAASATDIKLDEVLDLFYSLRAPYRNKSIFMMHDLTVKAIRKLKDANGQYLWQPSIKEAAPDTVLGRPLLTSVYMPEVAAGNKTMMFGDFSYYWIADRQSRIFRRLNELYAETGQVGFLATQRVDGRLTLPEAVKYLQQKA